MSKDLRPKGGGWGSCVAEVETVDELHAAPAVAGLVGSLRRWWKQQTAPRIEDEVVDRSGGRSIIRFLEGAVAHHGPTARVSPPPVQVVLHMARTDLIDP